MTTNGWWQLSAIVPANLGETVAWLVAEELNMATEVQDAGTLLKADDADHSRVVIHCSTAPTPPLMVALTRALNTVGQSAAPISTREHVETNWRDGWRAFFKPLILSERFGVHPPWTEPLDVLHSISIDPGMAFGTGSHATTRGVMQAVDGLLADRAALTVLDVGTGSGILAIAAAMLGHDVLGVEIDSTALENAAENVATNGAPVRLQVGSAADVPGTFDLVIANIIAPILIEIAPAVMARVGDDLLLSGVLDWQVDDVLAAYAPMRLITRTVVADAESPWTVLHLQP